jgi:hypothetical protein
VTSNTAPWDAGDGNGDGGARCALPGRLVSSLTSSQITTVGPPKVYETETDRELCQICSEGFSYYFSLTTVSVLGLRRNEGLPG